MKKNYILLAGLVVGSCTLMAQQNVAKFQEAQLVPTVEEFTAEKPLDLNINKAYNDTLYFEDLDSASRSSNASLPIGWTSVDNTSTNSLWIWDDQAPGGMFSGGRGPLGSATAANGFLSLPCDRYNTPLPATPTTMDAYVQTSAITITPKPSVLLRFTHAQRYCCSGNNELKVSVSTDGINWTDYDATFGRNPNTAIPTSNAEINISPTVANSATVYLRFHAIGNSHYYWMIDDIALVEGPTDNIVLEDFAPIFDATHDFNPVYFTVPHRQMVPMNFEGYLFNFGSNTQTNVKLDVSVDQVTDYTGGAGQGNVFTKSSTTIASMPTLQRDTVDFLPVDRYINTQGGNHALNFLANATQGNQNLPSAQGAFSFDVVDAYYGQASLDETTYVGGTGAGNYAGGGNDGDRFATLTSIHQNVTLDSLMLFIDNDAINIGARYVIKCWEWIDDSSTINAGMVEVGSTPFPYTITAADTGSFKTHAFFPAVSLTAGKQYAIGFEQVGGGATGNEVSVGRDRNLEPEAPAVTNFVFVNDANPSWGWVTQVPAIFAKFNSLIGDFGWPVGIDEQQTNLQFSVYPNPNNGQFKLNVSMEGSSQYTLNVRNMIGQNVYSELVNVNTDFQRDMDFTGLDKGVYFVTLENETERHVQKVIIK